MSNTYAIRTEQFGVIHLEADSIAEARKEARQRFGVGPRGVWRVYRERPFCEVCDSRPCCCPRRHNPPLPASVVEQHIIFHGVEPERVEAFRGWVPGRMTCVGRGIDISYGIIDKRSTKDGAFFHPHDPDVLVYQRLRGAGRADLEVKRFPADMWALGEGLGLRYQDGDGAWMEVETEPGTTYLCWVGSLRALVVVGPEGVEYLCKGGKLTVTDWIRG